MADGNSLRSEDLKYINPDDLTDLTDEEADDLLHRWELWARANQLEPEGTWWTTWLILAGRGFGKTRCGSETVIKWVRTGQCKRIALVAEDSADARDVMVEGESGILACSPRDFMPKYEPSKRRLTWPNGARATLFSAEDYDSLRGPQFDGAWCDELCKWRYAQEAWDNLQFGLRLGEHPKQIVTTTPRPISLLKDIIKRNDTVITKGSTMENLANLARPFRKAVVDKYMGTRIGRQELEAELLDDTPGALWSRVMIDELRFKGDILPDFKRVLIAVDPPATSEGEAGIIVVGLAPNGHGYVLEDRSLQGSPDEWAREAVKSYDLWDADNIIYEANHGGEMVAAVLRSAAKALKEEGFRTADFVPLKDVHATRGKYKRAEPISQLYEQGKVHHVGSFAVLEDQMVEYTPEAEVKAIHSPDRMDALVWGLTQLMIGSVRHEGLLDYYAEESRSVQDRLSGKTQAEPGTMISLYSPTGTNTAYGRSGVKYLPDADGIFKVEEVDVSALIAAGFVRKALEDQSNG